MEESFGKRYKSGHGHGQPVNEDNQ